MERMDLPEPDIINISPHDDHRQRDHSEERSLDDELSRGFQRLSIGEKKDKNRNRGKSLIIQSGKIVRRRSPGGGKQSPKYFEFYRFEKYGKDWTVADKIRINGPQDELQKRVVRAKSRIPVVDTMVNMNPVRREHINRLLDMKNNNERDRDVEWVPVLIEKKNGKGKTVLSMDVIIAKTIKPGRSGPREKRFSFAGEKSDLRVPPRSKSRDNYKDEDNFNEVNWNDRDRDRDRDRDQYRQRDFFAEKRLFTNDGRPMDDQGRPFDGHRGDRRSIPLEHPIGGPIQPPPPRQAPAGWDPLPPGPFPHDDHRNQPPIEVINDGQPGDDVIDLEKLLDNSNGGGGGHANQNFEVGVPPLDGASRRRSSGGRRHSGSRPRPTRSYTDQGPRRRSYRRADHYGESSIEDPDEAGSVFFYGDSGSSISSYDSDHDHVIKGRGSLNRHPSNWRGENIYREHRRRPVSYYPGGSIMTLETARTPRRHRRQTIASPMRQITYPYEGGRRRSDLIDEPLSPTVIQQGDSSGYSRRRVQLPELIYPDQLSGKDHVLDDYADHMRRENRFREDDLRRQERGFDERDPIKGREGSKGYNRDPRDGWR